MRPSTLVLVALLLPASASAQTRTAADVEADGAAVAPGSTVRVPVATTSGLTRTGRALHWAADTLFLLTQEGDTVAVPQARTSGLMTLRGPTHRSRNAFLGIVIGGSITAGIAAVAFKPEYGRRADAGDAFGCALVAILGATCNLPVRQINSKARSVAAGFAVGSVFGFLIGRATSHSRWEALSGAEVSASAGPSGTGLRLSIPTR